MGSGLPDFQKQTDEKLGAASIFYAESLRVACCCTKSRVWGTVDFSFIFAAYGSQ